MSYSTDVMKTLYVHPEMYESKVTCGYININQNLMDIKF